MWLIVSRPPAPDASYWPGRRLLALLDAVFWPAAFVAALSCLPRTGLVLPVAGAAATINALLRAHTALAVNRRRYRFSTWRLIRLSAILLVVGLALKLATYGRR